MRDWLQPDNGGFRIFCRTCSRFLFKDRNAYLQPTGENDSLHHFPASPHSHHRPGAQIDELFISFPFIHTARTPRTVVSSFSSHTICISDVGWRLFPCCHWRRTLFYEHWTHTWMRIALYFPVWLGRRAGNRTCLFWYNTIVCIAWLFVPIQRRIWFSIQPLNPVECVCVCVWPFVNVLFCEFGLHSISDSAWRESHGCDWWMNSIETAALEPLKRK